MGAGIGVVALLGLNGFGPRTDLWCRIDDCAPVYVLYQRRPIAVIQRESVLVAAVSGSNRLDYRRSDALQQLVDVALAASVPRTE